MFHDWLGADWQFLEAVLGNFTVLRWFVFSTAKTLFASIIHWCTVGVTTHITLRDKEREKKIQRFRQQFVRGVMSSSRLLLVLKSQGWCLVGVGAPGIERERERDLNVFLNNWVAHSRYRSSWPNYDDRLFILKEDRLPIILTVFL